MFKYTGSPLSKYSRFKNTCMQTGDKFPWGSSATSWLLDSLLPSKMSRQTHCLKGNWLQHGTLCPVNKKDLSFGLVQFLLKQLQV